MYHTIMLTTDGSDIARAATPHAVTLASMAPEATVVCVSVIDTVAQLLAQATPSGWGYDGGRIAVESAEAAVAAERADAERILGALKTELEGAGVKSVRTTIVEGHAGMAIVAAAGAERADLVVMATHGRGGIGRAVLGSVADYVVRHATCPVLLVRPPQ